MKWSQINIQELSDTQYQRWYALMDRERRKRADHLCFSDDKKRTVAGEMLARKAISEWCNVPVESIYFKRTEYGKPFAAGLSVEFNISHSGNIVVCAISDYPVGIDVEVIRPIDLNMAKRICTDKDLTYLFAHSPLDKALTEYEEHDMLIRFFRIWTAKEAYFKCLGTGISDLKSIDYDSISRVQSFSQLIQENSIVSMLENLVQ